MKGHTMSDATDWDRVGYGPPINHCYRLHCLLRRRAELIAAGHQYGPLIDRVLRFIDRTKTVIIDANRDNPNPPF
jgi:hypothetical protein